MPFEGPIIYYAWLARFELPGHTMLLCDGGQVIWGADIYRSSDEDFGTIAGVEIDEESTGDQAPGVGLTFAPSSAAAAVALSSPDYQLSAVKIWECEVDAETGEVIGTPNLEADLQLDTTTLRLAQKSKLLDMELIPVAERLWLINEANTLSERHHKSVWPGELGMDNATGKPTNVAWGVPSAPRGSSIAAVNSFQSGLGGGSTGVGMAAPSVPLTERMHDYA